jgi:hypothetical protein
MEKQVYNIIFLQSNKIHHALSLDKRLGCLCLKILLFFEDDDGTVNIMMMKGTQIKRIIFSRLGIAKCLPKQ